MKDFQCGYSTSETSDTIVLKGFAVPSADCPYSFIHSTITAMESFIYWEKFFFKFKFTKSSGNVNRAKVARKDVFFDVLSSHKGTHRYSEFSVKQLVS